MPKFLNNFSAFLITSGVFFSVATVAQATSGPVGLNGLRTESGPGIGQVTLDWFRYYSQVDNYSIAYGTQSGNYIYNTGNIGNVSVDTIAGLNPGQRYYFFVYPSSQGQPLPPTSPEVSEIAASSPKTVRETAGPTGPRALTAVTGSAQGQVTLMWNQILPNVNDFSILYGIQPGVYQYGALNVFNGTTGSGAALKFTIGALNPGQRYYFAVIPMQNGQALYSSAEVSQVAHR